MKKQPGLRNKVDQLTLQFLATSRDNMELTEWSLRERNKYREQIAHLFHQLHYDDDNTSHVISQIRTEYKNFIRACLHHLKMHERKCHLLANSVEEEEPVPEDDEEGEELELDVDLLDDQTEEVPEELVSPEDDEEACVKSCPRKRSILSGKLVAHVRRRRLWRRRIPAAGPRSRGLT